MRLREFDSQLADLIELYGECDRGNARLVVIGGVTASGKTALLHSLAAYVTEAGGRFAEATGSRTEQPLPLGIVDQLLCNGGLPFDVARPAAAILGDGPAAAETMPHASWVNDLRTMLRDAAARQPLVLAVDDAHYADQASLKLLIYLFRRLKSARVMLVIARDVSLQRGQVPAEADPIAAVDCRRVHLPLLSRARVADVVGQWLGARAGRAERLGATYHRVSGGNPFLLDALIGDHAPGENASGVEFAPGDAFRGAVTSCLRRTEPMICRVAQAVAVVGEPVAPPLLDEALDLSAGSSAHALTVLAAMGLVVDGRYRHEAARTAVLDDMSPMARAATHLSAARLFFRQGAAPSSVAAHLLAADQVPDASMVVVLREAADLALARGEVHTATGYLRLVYRSCVDERQRAAVTSLLAYAEWQADPSMAARRVPDLLDAAGAGLLDRRGLARLALYLLWDGNVGDARVPLGALLREGADPTPEAPLTGGEFIWPWLLCLYPGLYPSIVSPGAVSSGAAGEAVPEAGSAAGRTPASLILRSGDAATLMATIRRASWDVPADPRLIAGESGDSALPRLAMALIGLLRVERYQEAASWCAAVLDRGADGRPPTWRALFSGIHSLISLRLGNVAATREYADAALTEISPRSWGVALGLPAGSLLLAATLTGDRRTAAECLRLDIPDQMYNTPFALYYLRARGRYHLMNESFEAALSDFQTCRRLATRWGLDLPSIVPWRTDAAEACLGLGRTDAARDLVDQQLARTGAEHSWARGIALRVHAATADAEGRVAALRESADLLRRSGDRVELARSYADLSRAYQALGDKRQARKLAREASTLADRCGIASRWVQLPAFDGPRTRSTTCERLTVPSGELSDAELRVARLAALGYTNRRIAGELYITTSTVEQHLTRIYRKLDVSSRNDLPLRLEQRHPGSPKARTITGPHRTVREPDTKTTCRRSGSSAPS